ncbi:MAG: sigma-70 family RNA polymerase sigma factor [Symploca sp. SIO2G7]|nr:sigma-70 family RNA polymerase sigma factor [Symploca sp. SIO2G7]
MTSIEPEPLLPKAVDGDNPLTLQTDEAVFATFKEGNINALGILYDRYGLIVYRLANKMLSNSQEAEDLTQEVFLNLQARPNYQQKRGSFYSYLMMLTRSQAIDRLRRRSSWWRRWQNLGKMTELKNENSFSLPLEKISTDERAKRVNEALEQLSTQQRQVLELSYYEGLSHSQIAQRLNLPLGTVKTHCRRGLLKLRQTLRDWVEKA